MTSTTLMKTLGSCRKQRRGFYELGVGSLENSLQSNLALPDINHGRNGLREGDYVITLTLQCLTSSGRKAETQRNPSANENHSASLQTQASWLQWELFAMPLFSFQAS